MSCAGICRSCACAEDPAGSSDMPQICSYVYVEQVRMMTSGVGWTWRHFGEVEWVPARHAGMCTRSREWFDMEMCRVR
jgi:hypothetical protein